MSTLGSLSRCTGSSAEASRSWSTRRRADAMAPDDPVSAELRIYLAEHIPDDTHHDEWVLKDLEVVG